MIIEIKEFIASNYRYEPDTGDLIRLNRRHRWGNKVVNEVSGTLSNHGYLSTGVRYLGKMTRYFNHRIAWFLMTGDFPPKGMDIDHINGIKHDNRWCNLRLAKRGQNNMNSGNPRNNTTGQKGVHPSRSRWCARIKVNGKVIHLGVFKTYEEAVLARKQGETTYFGEYSQRKPL